MEMRRREEILRSRSALKAGKWSKSKTEIKELEHWRIGELENEDMCGFDRNLEVPRCGCG
jgi:hypothetical protein